MVEVCSQRPHEIISLPKDQLPKSSLGKLSRTKLKERYEAGAFTEYCVASIEDPKLHKPLNSLTQFTIADVIAAETGIPRSSMHASDGLSSFGLDSLGYIRVERQLEKTLNLQETIPMPVLIRSKTISELGRYVHDLGIKSLEYDPIIPLVPTGSKTPLILAHPGGGEFLIWLNLLKYIPDRPVYALRVRGLQPNEDLFQTMDEMLK